MKLEKTVLLNFVHIQVSFNYEATPQSVCVCWSDFQPIKIKQYRNDSVSIKAGGNKCLEWKSIRLSSAIEETAIFWKEPQQFKQHCSMNAKYKAIWIIRCRALTRATAVPEEWKWKKNSCKCSNWINMVVMLRAWTNLEVPPLKDLNQICSSVNWGPEPT